MFINNIRQLHLIFRKDLTVIKGSSLRAKAGKQGGCRGITNKNRARQYLEQNNVNTLTINYEIYTPDRVLDIETPIFLLHLLHAGKNHKLCTNIAF